MHQRRVIAYVGGWLPSVTETFVYKELLAVRAEGYQVAACSVYSPKSKNITDDIQHLAHEVTAVYSFSNLVRSLVELSLHPVRSLSTLRQVFIDSQDSECELNNVRYRVLLQGFSSLGLARFLRHRGVAHIHAHMANTPTTIAMYTAKQLGVGFSFTGHANDLFVNRSLLKEKLQRASFVACISHWHRRFYQSIAVKDTERLPIVRCGVDIPPSDVVVNRPKSSNDDATSAFRVLSVGRLINKKGMDTLIRAIAMIDKKHALLCEIIGDGPQRMLLAKLIENLGVQNRVFLQGAVPNARVLEAVRRCDLFILACQHDPETNDQDGIPVSLMEAMAQSKCVVTSDFEPITELVIHGKTGLAVPERDVQALAAAIEELIADSIQRSRLADAGRTHVAQEFTIVGNAKKLIECFERCIEEQRSDTPPPSEATNNSKTTLRKF